ncbi:MAG: glycosyltransferase family 4 protein [Candidatus Hydrogenedentes bacterium]|nr:glycosyltransferase family 4 protein [Candidatus Hydrogenedentota bacterium]
MPNKPLHILITDPHLQGGGQVRYVSTLAAGLVQRGHKVTIGCRPGSVLVEQAKAAGAVAFDQFNFKGGVRPEAWRSDLNAAIHFLKEEAPDIIHVNGSQDHWTLAVADYWLERPVPLLRTRHNTYVVKNNLPNRLLNRQWTDFQIVVCDTVRRDLAAHPAFDGERLCTIHNGVDASLYAPDSEHRKKARAEFDCTDSDVVCGIVARLVEAKGHEFLFQAAVQLKEKCPQFRILVFGQGVLEKPLRIMATKLGIAPMVRFLGFRNDMEYCVQAFDICAQPSVDCDTSSFSMKEQMAAGIPVVASDYGGLTEIISNGKEGFVVPAGTVSPLADALKMLVEIPNLRTEMGEAGRQRAIAEFSSDVFVQRTLDVYRQVVEQHRIAKETGKIG